MIAPNLKEHYSSAEGIIDKVENYNNVFNKNPFYNSANN